MIPRQNIFTQRQKESIFRRDNYRCVVCCRGQDDGVEIYADCVRSLTMGGKKTVKNGETLCARHHILKNLYGHREVGKRMFIRLYELVNRQGKQEIIQFCYDILKVYGKHGFDEHIIWNHLPTAEEKQDDRILLDQHRNHNTVKTASLSPANAYIDQLSLGGHMFLHLHQWAGQDQAMKEFCQDAFKVYEKYGFEFCLDEIPPRQRLT